MGSLMTIVAVLLLAIPHSVQAQDTLPPVSHHQTLSANPFGFPFQWYNAEYERKMSEAFTVGISGSHFNQSWESMRRATLFTRFYPQRAALSGIYLGGRAGLMSSRRQGDRKCLSFAGVEIGRSWLVGPSRNVSFSVGVGLDRYFGEREVTPAVYPSLRFINVGIAF
jgi:hypothetical protein